jgi:hypothetical protein
MSAMVSVSIARQLKQGYCTVLQGFNGDVRERGHLEDLRVDEWILKWICKKQNGEAWTGFIWLVVGTVGENL